MSRGFGPQNTESDLGIDMTVNDFLVYLTMTRASRVIMPWGTSGKRQFRAPNTKARAADRESVAKLP
jgi:hypothetical protein